MFPFILIGWVIAYFQKKGNYDIYFFFPFYHVGGAEKVHYQIAQTFQGKRGIIFFTRKSIAPGFLQEFRKTGFVLRDISKFTDNKLLYPLNFVFRGLVSYQINHQQEPLLVFNGQSNFGYKISPWISKTVPQTDLIHALCSFSTIRIPFLEFYKKSVTVSREIIEKHRLLYQNYNLPPVLINNIEAINYGIELPERIADERNNQSVNILYVGRGSEEKRIYLVAAIAKAFSAIDANVTFNFLGDVDDFIPTDLKKYCILRGTVTDTKEVDTIYRQNDVLLITSSTESGPLVAMEAMARGLCILSTPVGIINEHIKNGKNGFTFTSVSDENLIVTEAIHYINELNNKGNLRTVISENNMDYAYRNFGIEKFREAYRLFFKILNPAV